MGRQVGEVISYVGENCMIFSSKTGMKSVRLLSDFTHLVQDVEVALDAPDARFCQIDHVRRD
jgi:hypothetical protein